VLGGTVKIRRDSPMVKSTEFSNSQKRRALDSNVAPATKLKFRVLATADASATQVRIQRNPAEFGAGGGNSWRRFVSALASLPLAA
jgi:hypothetical protein